jgi:hypothetical protein
MKFRVIALATLLAMLATLAQASEIVLEASAIEKTLKHEVFDAQGRYHLVTPTTCTYSYLDSPSVSISGGRLRIKSHLTSQAASQVGKECVGGSDEFDVTLSGRPVYRAEKIVIDDIKLDDVSDLAWRPLLEVFIKRAAPKMLEINLRQALQRTLKDANTAYDVLVEKIAVTKLVAEENKVRADIDFLLRAR